MNHKSLPSCLSSTFSNVNLWNIFQSFHPKVQLSFAFFCLLLGFFICLACIAFFVSLCRLWADIILWKGNDPTVLRLCMCGAQCNGLAFYCLPHTNLKTEGIRWHLQGNVYERQPHMKEWPLKMIKEITALGCTILLLRLARWISTCPTTHIPWCTYTLMDTYTLSN